MRTKQPGFLDLLEAFLTEHMPFTAGLSENTIRLYKFTFRLLLDFFYTKKGVNAGKLTFAMLDYEAITAFLDWLETERGCSASTRNVRLAALSSFAAYAQNRNLEAASVFCSSVRKVPAKKTAAVPRITFTVEEVSLLLRLPDSRTHEHMTVSCIEAIYRKYLREAKERNPALFREKRYSPHTMRHTCATHMLEAGVPLVAIKNFLGHATLTTTERYAELSQATVDRHIRDWNSRWFRDSVSAAPVEKNNPLPDFLK